MKRLAASLLAACMLVACSDTVTQPDPAADGSILTTAADAHAKGIIERVTGSGHFETQPPALNPGIWRTFTMNAKKKGDGSVTGYAQYVYHPDEGEDEVFRGTQIHEDGAQRPTQSLGCRYRQVRSRHSRHSTHVSSRCRPSRPATCCPFRARSVPSIRYRTLTIRCFRSRSRRIRVP